MLEKEPLIVTQYSTRIACRLFATVNGKKKGTLISLNEFLLQELSVAVDSDSPKGITSEVSAY